MLVDVLWQVWAVLVWLLEKLPSYAFIFTAFAAAFAWLALRANRKAFEGKLLSDLMNEYASEDMINSMKKVEASFGNPTARPCDVDRRRLSHYFQKIYRLRRARFITEGMVRTAIDAGQAAFFLKMEPLEEAVHKERKLPVVQGDDPFRFYAKLYGLPRVKAQPIQAA